jgi:hypothetical protein
LLRRLSSDRPRLAYDRLCGRLQTLRSLALASAIEVDIILGRLRDRGLSSFWGRPFALFTLDRQTRLLRLAHQPVDPPHGGLDRRIQLCVELASAQQVTQTENHSEEHY